MTGVSLVDVLLAAVAGSAPASARQPDGGAGRLDTTQRRFIEVRACECGVSGAHRHADAARAGRGFDTRDPRAARARFAERIPIRRYGAPDDVAALVPFRCRRDAGFIDGGPYTVDGGSMA